MIVCSSLPLQPGFQYLFAAVGCATSSVNTVGSGHGVGSLIPFILVIKPPHWLLLELYLGFLLVMKDQKDLNCDHLVLFVVLYSSILMNSSLLASCLVDVATVHVHQHKVYLHMIMHNYCTPVMVLGHVIHVIVDRVGEL